MAQNNVNEDPTESCRIHKDSCLEFPHLPESQNDIKTETPPTKVHRNVFMLMDCKDTANFGC